MENHKVLKTLTSHGYTLYRDGASKARWIFNGKTFWGYDDPALLTVTVQS